jgi:hypothetical protein
MVLVILGAAFVIAAVCLLLSTVTVGTYAWLSHGLAIAGQHFFPVGLKETALLLSGLSVVSVLALSLLLGGVVTLRPTWKAAGWVWAVLGGVLLLSLAGGIALGIDAAPRIRDRYTALHHTAVVQTEPFTKVVLGGEGANYVFIPDTTYKVQYRYLGNNPATFVKGVTDGTLSIEGGILKARPCNFFCSYENDLTVEIHAPNLPAVTLTGIESSFTNDGPLKVSDFTLTASRQSHFNLRYVNPVKVTFASSLGNNGSQLTLNGLQTNAFDSDTIGGNNAITISRAGTVELKTDAQCTPNERLIYLLSYPDSLIINGQAFSSKGDLRSKQVDTQQLDTNCVTIEYNGPATDNS